MDADDGDGDAVVDLWMPSISRLGADVYGDFHHLLYSPDITNSSALIY